MANNPLLDQDFLYELFKQKSREVYAKIILLDLQEMPKADFSGRVTQGSVNLDGNSAIRRTCSLTLAAELNETDSYMWALNSKFKLEVGLKNVINPNYPEIIWFPMGIYFITNFNLNKNTTQTTISISGKDKMAMLTGDLGGVVPALTWDFGSIEVTDAEGNTTVEKYLIKKIIRELVHEFAKEPFQNIIINDLEDNGLELLQYNYSQPMYLIRDVEADIVTQFTLSPNQGTYYIVLKNGDEWTPTSQQISFNDPSFIFDNRNSVIGQGEEPTYFTTEDYLSSENIRPFTCIKAEKGDTIGYRPTELVYAGDLIASVGESVVSVLDKIKNMLGDYEYFYNLDGQFVFQRKRISLSHPWNQLSRQNDDNKEIYIDLYADEYDYSFDENTIVSSFSNTPNIANVKNDFIVWGEKKGISGNKQIPVHCRYAIQTKPQYYKAVDETVYVSKEYAAAHETAGMKVVDWREIIYQMALDYRKHMHDAATPDADVYTTDELIPTIARNNPDYYPDGNTGYEQFYTDMEGFWRLLYNPEYLGTYSIAFGLTQEKYNDPDTVVYYFKNQGGAPYQTNASYYKRKGGTEVYYYAGKVTREEFETQSLLYYLPVNPKSSGKAYDSNITYFYLDNDDYYMDPNNADTLYWNKEIFSNPESLIFWFDFIDVESNSELSQYAIDNIGLRTIAKNDNAVKAVVYKDVPNVLFVENKDAEEIAELKTQNTGYTILPLNENLTNVFSMSVQGKSAKDEIDSMIYNKACCCESITMSCAPIYSLEPNAKIYVKDTKAGINGAYLADKFSINLAYNGMMNITATKIIDRII